MFKAGEGEVKCSKQERGGEMFKAGEGGGVILPDFHGMPKFIEI